jgi:hypothetical protein
MESFSRPVAEARSVSDLVEQARSGELRIPPFQRRFRWNGMDIERLFDSVRRGYPIGSILLWERSAPAGRVEFGPLAVEAPEDSDALWVVDGQQRLTSLIGVLAGPPSPGTEFDLYYDLSTAEFKRPGSRRPRADWVPLRRVVDTNEFVNWLLEFREDGGATDEQVKAATELGNQLRDYKIPVSLVRNAEEKELRDIFDRMNTFGRRLTKAEVFQSLHSASDGSEPADLRSLVDEVSDLGFGSLQEDTVLRAVLAVRGGDPYRDFRNEFRDDEDPAAAFTATSAALRLTVDFLQRDAGIPHLRALPYAYVVPVLTRFFAVHRDPSARNRVLLRRWVWRDAAAGGSGGSGAAPVLRRASQAIDEDEAASVQRLLQFGSTERISELDLSSHQLNRAAGRINLALLAHLHPLELETGGDVDVPALLDGGELLRLPLESGGIDSIASIFLHPPLRDDQLADAFAGASADSLASHGLPRDAVLSLLNGSIDDLLARRTEELQVVLPAHLSSLTEVGIGDRPAIATLAIPDDDA